MKKSSIRYPIASVFAVILLLLGGTFGVCLHQKSKLLFSGSASGNVHIAPGSSFVCNLTVNTVTPPETPPLILRGKAGEKILSFSPELSQHGTSRQVKLLFHFPGKSLSCGTWPVGYDNPRGQFDFRIAAEGAKVKISFRERCAIYQGLFREAGSVPVTLPEIAAVEISPRTQCRAEIHTAEMNRKIFTASKVALEVLFTLLLSMFAGTFFLHLRPRSFLEEFPTSPAGIIFTGLLTFGTVTLLYGLLPEVTPQLPDLDHTLLSHNTLNPETEEPFLYAAALTAGAASALIWHWRFAGKNFFADPFWYYTSCVFSVFLIITLCFRAPAAFETLSPAALICALGAAAASALFILQKKNQLIKKYSWILPAVFIGIFSVLTAKCYLFRSFDLFDAHHYSVVLHPIWQSFHGFSVFENLSTYGAYAFFSLPFFKIASLSSTSVDFFWLLLLGGTFFFIWHGCRKFIPDPLCRTAATASVMALTAFSGSITHYTQYFPLRTIFPAMLFCWVACRRKKLFTPATCGAGSIMALAAIIWNPDSGFLLTATWIAFLISALYGTKQPRGVWFRTLGAVLGGAAGFFLLFILSAWMMYGTFPKLANLFVTPFVFGKLGLNQLPMKALDWWLLPLGVYCSVLTIIAGKIIRRNLSSENAVVLFTALLGGALFVYYTGRSHSGNLYPVCYPALILLGWGCGKLRNAKYPLARFLLLILLFFPMFLGMAALCTAPRNEKDRKAFTAYFDRFCSEMETALQKSGQKKIVCTTPWEALIAIEIKAAPPASHPALEEFFFKEDVEKYCTMINQKSQGALWVVNMNYLRKLAHPYTAKKIVTEAEKRLKRTPRDNELLLFKL